MCGRGRGGLPLSGPRPRALRVALCLPLAADPPPPPSPWRPSGRRFAGPGRGTNGWGRCALGEKAFSSDPRGCLGVPEPPSRRPSSARSGRRCGVTTAACWAGPPLREGSAGPAVGPSVALLPTAACASPLRVGGGSRRAWPASGARGSGVRASARAAAPSRRVSPKVGGLGCAPPPPPAPCRASGCLPPASRPESPPAVAAWARVGPLSPWGALPPPGRDSGKDRMDGWRFQTGVPPRRGVRVGLGPSGVWGRGPARGGGSPRVLRPAGVPGRRGTALVLVAVGSRARLPGGPARVFVGVCPSSRAAPTPTRSRPSPAVRPPPRRHRPTPTPLPLPRPDG